jgi:hypothetical protein
MDYLAMPWCTLWQWQLMDKLPCAGMKRLLISGDHWPVMQPAAGHCVYNIKHTHVDRGFGAQVDSVHGCFRRSLSRGSFETRIIISCGKGWKEIYPGNCFARDWESQLHRLAWPGCWSSSFLLCSSISPMTSLTGRQCGPCMSWKRTGPCLLESDMKQVWTYMYLPRYGQDEKA